MFSIAIPSYNNLDYLKLTIDSLKKNTVLEYEIIVHVNCGSDGTKDYLDSLGISYTLSNVNIGLCSAINKVVKLARFDYIIYSHDDVYFCPSWDIALKKEIDLIKNNNFYFSCTLIEQNSGHIKFDCGNDLQTFNEQKLLQNLDKLNFYDYQGSHWSPLCVHKELWNKISGFSEEFNPGIGSDPDFNMKLWEQGVRIFKGINNFKVYHFGSLTTRKKISIKRNKGDNTFLIKWGFSIKFFKKFYMNTNSRYINPLNDPKKNFSYYFYMSLCKLKLFYLRILNL